jgi:hypothetical protein
MATTYQLPGQDNSAGADDALFLKMYGGEVLASFNAMNIMEKYHRVNTYSAGKSFQFPKIGRATAAYWDGSTELTGMEIDNSEVEITIDDLLYHDLYIREIDELKDHVSKRQEYARQQGEAIANTFDYNVLRMGILASRASATITSQSGDAGTEITDADSNTNGASLAASLFTAATNMDNKYVPASDRFCFVKPAQYYLLAQTTDVINKDWGGDGSYARGLVHAVADVNIVKTTNLPQANDTSNTDIPSKYRANYSTVTALVMHPEAVRTAKLMGVKTEMDYKTEHQATHLVAKMLLGSGINRPEAAVSIKTS